MLLHPVQQSNKEAGELHMHFGASLTTCLPPIAQQDSRHQPDASPVPPPLRASLSSPILYMPRGIFLRAPSPGAELGCGPACCILHGCLCSADAPYPSNRPGWQHAQLHKHQVQECWLSPAACGIAGLVKPTGDSPSAGLNGHEVNRPVVDPALGEQSKSLWAFHPSSATHLLR